MEREHEVPTRLAWAMAPARVGCSALARAGRAALTLVGCAALTLAGCAALTLAGCAALTLAGCADKAHEATAPHGSAAPAAASKSPVATGSATSAGTGAPSAPAPSTPALADSPEVDLLANRYRLHLYDGDALVVTLASEGLRKYTNEYNQPFGDAVVVDGRRGRVLENRSAVLNVPWGADQDVEVFAVVDGLAAGQRIELRANGKRTAVETVDASWQVVPLGTASLHAGENDLTLYASRKASAAGHSSYGLWHSLVLRPAASGAPDPEPPHLEPVATVDIGGQARPALTGFSHLRIYTEIPETGWLEVDTGVPDEAATVHVIATPVDGKPVEVLTATQERGWTHRQVSLKELAGQLVALDFTASTPAVAWASPRLALEEAPSRPHPKAYQNAILVVVDALRADRLRLYGDTPVRTPRITEEGERYGVVFQNMQAASPSSPPSHGSIQTGMIPRVHGVVGDRAQLEPGTPMLSTQARDAGLAVGYYGDNAFGMARLEKPGHWTEFHQPAREGKGIDCTALVDEMLGFARKEHDAGKRFVISSLPYEPHTPYRYHEGVTEHYFAGPFDPPVGKFVDGTLLGAITSGRTKLTDEQWKQLKALYNGEVEHFDGCFATLMDGLEKMGIRDQTAVILTADHGEGMYEHGHLGHAWGHYSELANVPLVLLVEDLLPGARKIETVSSHLDITPTLLDLVGAPIDPRVQGMSLLPIVLRDGPWTPRVVSLEYGRSFSLRSRRWKYIRDYAQNEELYDLQSDPHEHHALGDERPFALRYMREMAGFFLAHRSEWTYRTFGDLDNHAPGFAKAFGPASH